jgi:CHAT domain-containing protein
MEDSNADPFTQAAWLGQRQAITVLPSIASLKAARIGAKSSAAPNPFIGFANPLLLGESGDDRSAWAKQTCPAGDAPVAVAERQAEAPRAIGNVLFGGSVDLVGLRTADPLPETADEVCAVARDLGAAQADVYLGARASEAMLKNLSGRGALKDYRVLHFATHGLIAGETEMFAKSKTEPSLLLTPPDFASVEDDGLLTASEVAELSLDADAVILSACNTASDSGARAAEALSGLARAFFYAGARALLVTHWCVNSQAAVDLVTRIFDARKAEPGLDLAEAMRRAMRVSIQAGGRQAHPDYWAPFVVVAAN